MTDTLGDRMKDFYENRTRIFLPRRTYTIIRLDGKAFHTYTRGLCRPFDYKLINDMDETAKFLCREIQGAKLAFVQSDEISLLITDFDKIGTDAYFNGNIQKIASVSASLATAKFNELRPGKLAIFDSRVFTIPSHAEVENYFIWRQKDCIRNAVSIVAQSLFSQKQLHGVSTPKMLDMIYDTGFVFDALPKETRNGRLIEKVLFMQNGAKRTKWEVNGYNSFVKDRVLSSKIPSIS